MKKKYRKAKTIKSFIKIQESARAGDVIIFQRNPELANQPNDSGK